MNEIYGDIYFLINFSMDMICLYITSLILRKNTGIGRLILGGAFGALYSFLTLFLQFNVFIRFLITFFAAFIICFLAFYDRKASKSFIFPTFIFIAISFFMGGTLTYIYSFLGGLFEGGGDDLSIILLPCSLVFGGISFLLWRMSEKKRSVDKTMITVFTHSQRDFSALVDTGNLLREPIGGLPVVILSQKASREYIQNGDILSSELFDHAEIGGDIRIIPVTGAGYSGILTGFIPKGGIKVGNGIKRCCIAFSDTESFDGCEALLPSVLFS